MVQLMVTSSKRAHATRCVSQVCCSQRPCPRSRPSRPLSPQETLRHFIGSSGSVSVVPLGPGMQKLLFEPSKHLWRVWGLILNVILPLPLSCWGLSFALGCGLFYFFFGGIQYSAVDGCSAASCNFGVITEDGCMSFYSAILNVLYEL